VRAWSEARYSGAGYDHLVYVANDCVAAISCATWTDVNPEPQALSIAPGETVVALTFRGSPASTFIPYLSCASSPPEERSPRPNRAPAPKPTSP
jgi:hypothetical protein